MAGGIKDEWMTREKVDGSSDVTKILLENLIDDREGGFSLKDVAP